MIPRWKYIGIVGGIVVSSQQVHDPVKTGVDVHYSSSSISSYPFTLLIETKPHLLTFCLNKTDGVKAKHLLNLPSLRLLATLRKMRPL